MFIIHPLVSVGLFPDDVHQVFVYSLIFSDKEALILIRIDHAKTVGRVCSYRLKAYCPFDIDSQNRYLISELYVFLGHGVHAVLDGSCLGSHPYGGDQQNSYDDQDNC